MPTYHLELRAFPHVARVFNLDREALDTRFLRPYAAGEIIEYEDRRWAPEKTKLTVLEGRELAADERGMGRGWGEVTRHAENVTETVLAEIHRGAAARPELESLKDAIASIGRPITFPDVIALAAAAQPLWRASEQLSLAEQAVWELLHQRRLELRRDGGTVPAEGWQAVILTWATWTAEPGGPQLSLVAVPPPLS